MNQQLSQRRVFKGATHLNRGIEAGLREGVFCPEDQTTLCRMSKAWLVNRSALFHQFYKTTHEDTTKAWEPVTVFSQPGRKPLIQQATCSVLKSLRQSSRSTDLLLRAQHIPNTTSQRSSTGCSRHIVLTPKQASLIQS